MRQFLHLPSCLVRSAIGCMVHLSLHYWCTAYPYQQRFTSNYVLRMLLNHFRICRISTVVGLRVTSSMYLTLRLLEATSRSTPDRLFPTCSVYRIHGGLLGLCSLKFRACVDPAWWLERWRLTLENPYTVSVDPMLTTGDIPVITPEPVALSCVTSQCARSYGLLVRSDCSDGGFRHRGITDTRPRRGLANWQGIRGVVNSSFFRSLRA